MKKLFDISNVWFFIIFMVLVNLCIGQNQPFGVFEGHSDIGNVKKQGNISYNPDSQEYSIEGSGANIWYDNDEFHYVWKRMKGDFILTANAGFVGNGVEEHRKTGWMIRAGMEPDAAHISATVHGDGLTSLQFRRTKGGNMEEVRSLVSAPSVIQLERKGNIYRMSVARGGNTFSTEQVTGLALGDDVYIGLFVCSHNKEVTEKALFYNVRITVPVPDNYVPYKDYIGSNLETMDISNGCRKIIYQSPHSLQAPNWTTDGKSLIYNSNGLLYNFNFAKGVPAVLNTGFATTNNNDHVLSFDGKMIGISHHSKDDGNNSVVYVLPVTGGNPKRITSKCPSYLHGWSPDGKYLIYTGGRNGMFDIYKISVKGGEEIQLTKASGLNDGSEYSPDGNYIYFNSNRTGVMQIWRMKPDGSAHEQITFDGYNNWFPHLSPDGKWIVFLSFNKDVDAGDHPFYKHVYLRLMPSNGGEARVVAYLYGGQGTINVPSWSPDGKKIAFISNTDMK